LNQQAGVSSIHDVFIVFLLLLLLVGAHAQSSSRKIVVGVMDAVSATSACSCTAPRLRGLHFWDSGLEDLVLGALHPSGNIANGIRSPHRGISISVVSCLTLRQSRSQTLQGVCLDGES
jgi:hypothetical protein